MLIRVWESIIGLILKLSHANYGAMHLDALLPNIFSWVIFFFSFIKQLSLFSCMHQSIDQSFHFCATFIWSCTKSMNIWLFFSHLHMDKNKFVWDMSTMLNRVFFAIKTRLMSHFVCIFMHMNVLPSHMIRMLCSFHRL